MSREREKTAQKLLIRTIDADTYTKSRCEYSSTAFYNRAWYIYQIDCQQQKQRDVILLSNRIINNGLFFETKEKKKKNNAKLSEMRKIKTKPRKNDHTTKNASEKLTDSDFWQIGLWWIVDAARNCMNNCLINFRQKKKCEKKSKKLGIPKHWSSFSDHSIKTIVARFFRFVFLLWEWDLLISLLLQWFLWECPVKQNCRHHHRCYWCFTTKSR